MGDSVPGLLVAEEALGTNQGQKFVFVVDDKGKSNSATSQWAGCKTACASLPKG